MGRFTITLNFQSSYLLNVHDELANVIDTILEPGVAIDYEENLKVIGQQLAN